MMGWCRVRKNGEVGAPLYTLNDKSLLFILGERNFVVHFTAIAKDFAASPQSGSLVTLSGL